MRVNKKLSPSVNRNQAGSRKIKKISSSASNTFKEEMADSNQREVKKKLDKLLVVLDEQGQKLQKTLDKSDLAEYKKRVQNFLRLVQQEYARVKQSYSWDSKGNMRTYTIIDQIDSKLAELHTLFVEGQQDTLQVLKKIDEIRGLLLDLYI